MLHIPFQHINQLEGTSEKFSDAFLIFLQSVNVPSSLEDDIRRLSDNHIEQDENEVLNILTFLNFYFLNVGKFSERSAPN